MYRPQIALAIALLSCAGCDAYTRIDVRVVTHDRVPIPNAQYELASDGQMSGRKGNTDRGGQFSVGHTYGLGSKPRSLQVRAAGFKALTVTPGLGRFECVVSLGREGSPEESTAKCAPATPHEDRQ